MRNPTSGRPARTLEATARNALRANEVIDGIRSLFKKNIHGQAQLDVNQVIRQVLKTVSLDLRSHHLLCLNRTQRRDCHKWSPTKRNWNRFLQESDHECDRIDRNSGAERVRLLRITSNALRESSTVLLTIEDTGTGIDSANEARIFEPFFTTKSKGMGIGLFICRTIVETHGGRLAAFRNEPYGTTFQITLPSAS